MARDAMNGALSGSKVSAGQMSRSYAWLQLNLKAEDEFDDEIADNEDSLYHL